jgi:tetratricopeptide (TPR) repeat protein
MELFYNPDLMPEDEIKETFVAREALVDELVSLVEHQPDGAGVQHALIIAPRGMGKTTVLLMVGFALKDRGLGDRWLAVKFPEESYGVYDLADFWLEALDLLAGATNDELLRERSGRLKSDYPKGDDLQEAALALIKDWCREHNKRLVLLVDNLDMILEQINDERDNARLRDVLMNDGAIMMIGCAVSFFREAREYDQPLYNFFKIFELNNLRFDEMQDLLRRRAKSEGREDFNRTLKANPSRLRVLEYFTGGNPRLVLMLYRVVTNSDISEVRRSLEKLLDEVTPYYKAKVESLPPQQRKILDHIARVSNRTGGGATPGQIAEVTRLSPNQVSAQLKRLTDSGYVRAAALRGRSSYYTLSEPLYAVWHQMRMGHNAHRRIQWLVDFVKLWYDTQELSLETRRLKDRFSDHVASGRLRQARAVLEHRWLVAEAVKGQPYYQNAMAGVIRAYADIGEMKSLKTNVTSGIDLSSLSEETLTVLYKTGCVSEQDFKLNRASLDSYGGELGQPDDEGCHLGCIASSAGRFDEAVREFDRELEIKPDKHEAWNNRGNALSELGRHEEAVASYDRAVEIKPDDHEAWNNRGNALSELGRHEEAVASYDRAVEIKPDYHGAWYNRADTYLVRLTLMVKEDKPDSARADWAEALKSSGRVDDGVWLPLASKYLTRAALSGQFEFIRQLLAESGLGERLFPLALALDHLASGEEALLEKLSPEVRGIVEEVVRYLKSRGDKAGQATKPPARKRKTQPRARKSKQLR